MKRSIIFIAFLLISVKSLAQFPWSGKDGPVITFTEGTLYDFGTIPEGPIAEHQFEFTNTGNQPLIIKEARPTCSCTIPDWPKEPILPGKKGVIKVGYKSATHKGEFYKDVAIFSNALNNNAGSGDRYIIYFKGTVKP